MERRWIPACAGMTHLPFDRAFARPGHDPSRTIRTRPAWPPFAPSRSYLVLDTPISTVVDPSHHCDLWDQVGYVLIDSADLLPDD